MKRCISLTLALVLALALCVPARANAGPGFANLRPTARYSDGLFSDVAADSPYRDSVAAVYELGLMLGSGGVFGMAQPLSHAEALVLACRLHSLYNTGEAEFPATDPWYRAYWDYASDNGLPAGAEENAAASISRGDFAVLLSQALPGKALPALNDVPQGRVGDVPADAACAGAVYSLYRAGIFSAAATGRTNFRPDDAISHAEAAAALARMARRSLRVKFTLREWSWPDLALRERAEDAFFADSAMLGSSLAQGMGIYSGLHGIMDFYGDEYTSIIDAERWMEQLCANSYRRVYITYGVFDLYSSPENFCALYAPLVDRIRAAMPEAEIYVISLAPVTRERAEDGNYSMEAIRAFNEALYRMAEEKQCWYLDVYSALCGEDGYLPPEYAGWDGSPHLSVEGYCAWEEVMRTRYA